MKTVYTSIKFIVASHLNMLQLLHLPENSVIKNVRKYHSKIFNLFNMANNNINSTFKRKRKLA